MPSPRPAGDVGTLSYAAVGQDVRPVNVATARWHLYAAIASVSLGLLILVVYRLTAWEWLPQVGMLWLMGGGCVTSACALVSLVRVASIRSSQPNAFAGRKTYGAALVVALISYPIALGCIGLGGEWMQGPHFRLRVFNDTAHPIDAVTAHFDGGDVRVTTIPSGGSAVSGLRWVKHAGPLYVTLKAKGGERKFVDRIFYDPFNLRGPYFDVRIEQAELPR